MTRIDMRRGLREGLRFLRADAHHLRQYPRLFRQRAVDQPDDSVMAVAARRRLIDGRDKRAWFAWVNKPQPIDPCVMTFTGHWNEVRACRYSPDGKHVLSASGDQTLKLWNAQTGQALITFEGHQYEVNDCAFSPDGQYVLSAGVDRTLRLWDASTGKPLGIFEGHDDWVTVCGFSPDGSRVVSGSMDGTIRIWEVKTRRQSHALDARTGESSAGRAVSGSVATCLYSPDGAYVVFAASGDEALKWWDARTERLVTPPAAPSVPARTYAFSSDGRYVIGASAQGQLIVLDVKKKVAIAALGGHSSVSACAFSPDATRVVTASYDKTLKLWNPVTGEELATLIGHVDKVTSCAFSPDGKCILSGSYDRTLRMWDASGEGESAQEAGHKSAIAACAFSPDGKYIASLPRPGDSSVRVWDGETGQELATLAGDLNPREVCRFSPDGTRLIAVFLGTIKSWDAATWSETGAMTGHRDTVAGCDYSPCGRRLVSASWDGALKIWDTATSEEIATLTGHKKWVVACQFSPDGRRLVSASNDTTLKLWDAQTGACIVTLTGHVNRLRTCSYSPDGRLIVSVSSDHTVKLWDALTGTAIATHELQRATATACAFSPDGRYVALAATDGTVRIWDPRTREESAPLTGHAGVVSRCAYSADGRRIVSISGGPRLIPMPGTDMLRVWNASTGDEIAGFMAGANIEAFAQGRSGRFAVGDESGRIYLLRLGNVEAGAPIVTAAWTWQFSPPGTRPLRGRLNGADGGTWSDHPLARCTWCGGRFVPGDRAIDAIRGILQGANLREADALCTSLPSEAWREPRLLSECPACGGQLQFNPFLVDNRERY